MIRDGVRYRFRVRTLAPAEKLVERAIAALFPQQGNATQRVARTISQGTAAAAVAPCSL